MEQGVHNLFDLVDYFGLPSMPKREIINIWLKQSHLLTKRKIDKKKLCVLIIVLSLMSNLISMGKTIAYIIQVLSLSLLMKKIWKGFNELDVTKVTSGKVELWLCNVVQELAKIVIT